MRLFEESGQFSPGVDEPVGAEIQSRFWDRMALASSPDEFSSYQLTSPGLARVLGVLETGAGTADTESGGDRVSPSAGAIHPYEFYVLAREDDGPAAFRADPARRTCWRVSTSGDAVQKACEEAGVSLPAPSGALVLVVNRPWLSMRKYGDRGYFYAQLDAAHVAVSVLGVAHPHGVLRLRFRRRPLEDLLGLGDRCRAVHSLLQVESFGQAPPSVAWRVQDTRWYGSRPVAEETSWLEHACWRSLSPLRADDAPTPATDAEPAPLARLPGHEDAAPVLDEWRALARRRASSRRFRPATLGEHTLRRVVGAATTPLRTDLPEETSIGLTLVARSVAGGPAGARLAATTATDGDDVVRACMHQEHLRYASAFALLRVPRARLLGHHPSRMRELLFRAGGIAHLLYLGAAEADVAVTAIGGFDTEAWRPIAGLGPEEELLYVMAFGLEAEAGAKLDRRAPAHAHNEH